MQNTKTFTSYQKFILAVLSFLQFTIVLDFMIMNPLGAAMMPALHITPSQFGFVVSAYAFSAGLSAILTAGFADRFDRKKLLLFFYVGFLLGTLFCALAPNYELMLCARVVTGFFGGVIGSITLAIAADLFPLELRGRVMGFLQTAFSASQILGIPAGLYISNLWGWHTPFLMIVAIAAVVGLVIFLKMRPVDAHLKLHDPDRNALHHLWATLVDPRHTMAFVAVMLLSTGGFMLMPFGSAFTVHNLGIDISHLPFIYLCGGLASIVTGPLVGKAADTFGKFNTFVFGAAVSIVMCLIYTNLGITPVWLAIVVNILLFIGIFSRMIPSQALTSAIPRLDNRGSFMAVSSALQQISGGIAAVIAGLIVSEGADGHLEHFNVLGYVIVCSTIISTIAIYFVHKAVPETPKKASKPEFAPQH